MVTLKQARKRAGYTQVEIAEILGVDHVTVSNWETGKTIPTSKRLLTMCKLYGVAPYEINLDKEEKDNGVLLGGPGAGGLGGDRWEDGPDD